LRNRLLLADAIGQATPEVINGNGSQIESNIVEIGKLWDAYMTTYQTPKEKQLAESFASVRGKFVKEGILPGLALLRANKVAEARTHYQTTISALNDAVAKNVELLNQLLMDEAKKEYDAATARFETIRNIAIALILFSLLLAVAAAMTLIRTIAGPLNDAANVFMQISQGIYGNFVDTTRNDETGKFLQKLEVMQTRLGFDVAEARRISDENLRIRIALDNVSTGVMIADTDRTIIYANKSVQKILKTAESAIRQQLPNFNAEHMIGVNIDTFHKNPAHQAKLLAIFSSTYTANLEISGRHLRVTASPVINARNERLGAVAEWQDRTGEVMVEKEVANIVDG
ncbi:MAG: Tar ligand binding domain-containing protein, partial [Sideroxyarcus sp.]|nr:Tar ligand binding domain-containing protein [Sideroxyarcus sp.]